MIRDLQLLRGIAVLFVVVAHLPAVFPEVAALHLNWLGWWSGVDIFFAVSGFVIARSFLPKMADGANKMRTSVAFWIRRIYRLLPASLFWATLLVLLAFTFNSSGIFGLPSGVLTEYFSVLLHMKNVAALYIPSYSMGPYWSLALEEQFYLLFPFIVMLIPALLRPIGFLIILFVVLILTTMYEPVMQYFRASPILAGILIYYLSVSKLHRRLEPTIMRNLPVRVAVLLGMFAALLVSSSYANTYRWFVITGVGTALVFLASYDKDYISLPGIGKAIEWVGDRSYSVYIAHMPMLLLAHEIGYRIGVMSTYILLPMALTMICLGAAVSYAALEIPMQRMGRVKANAYLAGVRGKDVPALVAASR